MTTMPTTRAISLEEWLTVPDNPIQRNTARHAEAANNKHLKEAASTHSVVHMATLPDGRCFKLDGHTRALLWEEQKLTPPEQIIVIDHPCSSVAEAQDLYTHFDNHLTVEMAPDKVYGAYRLHGIIPVSTLLKTCRLTTVMKVLPGAGNDIYEDIGNWKSEIEEFDAVDPVSGAHFLSGVIAGALITFRRYPEDAAKFWLKYQQDAGWKHGQERDGVQALREYVPQRKNQGQRENASSATELAERVISAFENWRVRRYYKSLRIGRTDLRKFLGE
ncbi:hypothetical protein [Magnetofaba australis]|uniref:ParB/Sulfiredoxin domain-containing protein n=1 Tax=Magnetofaba australis IT-1 TaxID=1434232 RepID=A0A1Y2K4K7_9PROT|nr:hypothetical protein [Magnetofaba australis]OSM04169.1 hypothetical protein MAIT1_04020 [Magnetofaba australis IT-1]